MATYAAKHSSAAMDHPGKDRIFALLCLIALLASACGPSPDESNQPTQVGDAQSSRNSITLRIDWIEIQGETGDLAGTGELYFDLMVIRENGDSRQLRAPGEGSYKITDQSRLQMDGFSLNVNNLQPGERILVYFTAFDSDEPGYLTSQAASIGLEAAMRELKKGLKSGKLLGKTIKHASVLTFILATVTGVALDWWKEADILGGHATILSPSNVWMTGHSYEALSDNGVLTIRYSVTASDPEEIRRLAKQDGTTVETADGLAAAPIVSTPVAIHYTALGSCFANEQDEDVEANSLVVGGTSGTRSEVRRKNGSYALKPSVKHDDDKLSFAHYTIKEEGDFELDVFDDQGRLLIDNFEFSMQPNQGKMIIVRCEMLSKSTFLPDLEVSYREEFNGPELPEDWGTKTEADVSVADGLVRLAGNPEGSTNLILFIPLRNHQGILTEFTFSDPAAFFLSIWPGEDDNQIGLVGNSLMFSSGRQLGQDEEFKLEPMDGELEVMANEWYFMEIMLSSPHWYEMRVWQKDEPKHVLRKKWQIPAGLEEQMWIFSAALVSEEGTLDIDYVEVLEAR